jgi:hypothetical protein
VRIRGALFQDRVVVSVRCLAVKSEVKRLAILDTRSSDDVGRVTRGVDAERAIEDHRCRDKRGAASVCAGKAHTGDEGLEVLFNAQEHGLVLHPQHRLERGLVCSHELADGMAHFGAELHRSKSGAGNCQKLAIALAGNRNELVAGGGELFAEFGNDRLRGLAAWLASRFTTLPGLATGSAFRGRHLHIRSDIDNHRRTLNPLPPPP